MNDLYIVTAASDNHYKSLKQFLNSVRKYQCFVYNLGLSEENIKDLQSFDIHYRVFDFSKYPDYYNININAGEYAWKSAIIKNTMEELLNSAIANANTVLLWCDAGNIVNYDLSLLKSHILSNKIYSPISSGTIRKWTYPKTLGWFSIGPNDILLHKMNRNGAILGFHISNKNVQTFINKYNECSGIKDCIAPPGSSRQNHRQDQAVFTILYYKFMKENPSYMQTESYFGIRIHCDCD